MKGKNKFLNAKFNKLPFLHHDLITLILSLTLFSINLYAQEEIQIKVHAESENLSAASLYSQLEKDGQTFEHNPLSPKNAYNVNGGLISYGAEKEGFDYKIAHVMGPTSYNFKKFVNSLDIFFHKNGRIFLRQLLKGIQNGDYLEKNVVDQFNHPKIIKTQFLQGIDLDHLSYPSLMNLFNKFLAQTGNRPFSFLNRKTRLAILEGTFTGSNAHVARNVLAGKYKTWQPLYGLPQKYLSDAEPAADYPFRTAGFEIKFKPQKSYGAYEEMMDWFKKEMRDNPEVEEKNLAPGNQRIVWPNSQGTDEEQNNTKKKIAETYKNIQSLIVLRGIAGNTGITTAKWKWVHPDQDIKKLQTWKGPIRLEHGRWPNGHRRWTSSWKNPTGAIELRAGTKDSDLESLIKKILVSRVAANDWNGISSVDDWKLIPDSLTTLNNFFAFYKYPHAYQKLAKRFNTSYSEMRKFINIVHQQKKFYDIGPKRRMDLAYLAPLWHWEDAPFISADKKNQLQKLTHDFIQHIIRHEKNMSFEKLQEAMKTWVKRANLNQDIVQYLLPQHTETQQDENKIENLTFNNEINKKINQIDLGIEFTAAMPIRDYKTPEPTGLPTSAKKLSVSSLPKNDWSKQKVTLDFEERKKIIKNTAYDLLQALPIPNEEKELVEIEEVVSGANNNHGRGINISYKFKDPRFKFQPLNEWRVEWDGIVRDYDKEGKVIASSARGGVVELVTPKFAPTQGDLDAVFTAFKKNSLVPQASKGGGHINLDLHAFDKKPREMARFLAVFHQYRDILSMILQSPQRLKSAEPLEVSTDLQKKLINFQGSEEELKQLLYNERYFNQRVGRKSRYTQIDVSNYFQDVIPEKYISEDYDIQGPQELWRQQFRVKPELRKMELRMVDAPANSHESALQLKLVKALLNKAFNDQSAISPEVKNIRYEDYIKNPLSAYDDLKKLTQDLGLNEKEYEGMLARKIQLAKSYLKSETYKDFSLMVKDHPKVHDWGTAVKMRNPATEGLNYQQRPWKLADGEYRSRLVPEAIELQQQKKKIKIVDDATPCLVQEKEQELQSPTKKARGLKGFFDKIKKHFSKKN